MDPAAILTPPPAASPAPAGTPPADPAAVKDTPPQWTGIASQLSREQRETHKDLLLGDYKDKKASDVWDELLDLKSKQSRALIIPDPKTATPEEMAAFKKTMGIPEAPEGYGLNAKGYENIPGMKELAEDFQKRAMSMGLPKGQAAQAFNYFAEITKRGMEGQEQAKKAQADAFPAALLESVGKDQKKADEVTNRVKLFMAKRIGDPEIVKAFADSGLLYSPKVALKLAELSKAFDDAPYHDGGAGNESKKDGMGHYSKQFDEEFGGNR